MRIRERRPSTLNIPRTRRRLARRPLLAACLRVETLETRSLLTVAGPVGSQVEIEPNATLDQAQLLGDLSTEPRTDVVGTIGNSPSGGGGVDWYRFTLDGPAHVSLDLRPRGSDHPLSGVLSLYDSDPLDFQDLYDPVGARLLTQAVGGAGTDPRIDRDLGPGTYALAVSGAGNLDFHPLLDGSGFAGATGDYDLRLAAAALASGPMDGPVVLTSDPAPQAALDASPLVLRLDFGAALDPTTVIAGQTVRLTYNPNGTFGDGNDQDVPLAWTNVGVGGTELQIAPAAPLAPGSYRVFLAGDSTAATRVVADLNATPLGADAAHPHGRDYTATFRVDGIEGQTGAHAASDDTAAGAHDLGNLTGTGLVQVAGAIGDDPFYNNSDAAHNPANDVDLYHFQISGPGRYALLAEVFAGRIGSPLDPGVSLYRRDPGSGTLVFLAGNNNTSDNVKATNSSTPLTLDSMLSQGLTAGDYYVAVADGANTPSPTELTPPGSPGLFDPNIAHRGQNGTSTGPYVLNLLVQATPQPPHVVSSNPAEGAVLDKPPTQLTVQFDEPVNIQQQGFANFLANSYCTAPAVFVLGSDGTHYYARVDSYNQATNQVTLLMLERLPAGSYTLHLSGPGGLADLGGNPIAGNDPSGDFVIHFTVDAVDPVQPDATGTGQHIDARLGPDGSQDLGVLFPGELQSRLTLVHDPAQDAGAAAPGGTEQTYLFTLLQDQTYAITLAGTDLPPDAKISIQAITGKTATLLSNNAKTTWFGQFLPGTYSVSVQGITSATAYQIEFALTGNAANPVPLVNGPAPALQLRFDSIAPPSTSGGPSASGSGGGVIFGPPSMTGNPSSPGGGTTVGGGGDGGVSGPSANSSTGSPGTTIAPGAGAAASVPLLITLNAPAQNPTTAPAGPGPVGGTTGEVNLAVDRSAAAATQAENLISGSLALLAIGPVGGVQQSGGSVAAVQVVQVSLPMQGNTPIPTGLVSLVTLSRTGELDEPAGPIDPAGIEPADAGPAGRPPVEVVAASLMVDPVRRVGEALRKIAGWWARPSSPASDVAQAADAGAGTEAAPVEQTATATPLAAADGTGGVGGGAPAVDGGVADAEALATASVPWLGIMAILGTVALYARRRRIARRTTAPRFEDVAYAWRSLFRLWGKPATSKLPHAMRLWRKSRGAAPRPNAGPRPRHLTNP